MTSKKIVDFELLSDNEVLEFAIQGDLDAFSVLYQRNISRIYTYIFYRTGNVHDAEDLTARVFHRAMVHIRNYRNTGVPFSAWLYRIAHNLVANWHRDSKRKQEVPLEDHELFIVHGDMPEAQIITSQESDQLLNGIRKLTNERQQLIILKFVEKLSNAEVAMIMGRSEGAIKSLYHRTLVSLRQELTNLPENDSD
jgi:RNA polymerase sigma-70 factor (ECF subfamily)